MVLAAVTGCNNSKTENKTADNMGFMTLAQERYSVREFKNTPVEEEKLNLILKAGQIAPTAINTQQQETTRGLITRW